MNQFVEKALFDLTGKSNINEVSTNELQYLVDQHPYFSVAQVLLAQKLRLDNSGALKQQIQKTVLYFNNPYLLHFQLAKVSNLDFPSTEEDSLELEEPSSLEISKQGNIRSIDKEVEPEINEGQTGLVPTSDLEESKQLLEYEKALAQLPATEAPSNINNLEDADSSEDTDEKNLLPEEVIDLAPVSTGVDTLPEEVVSQEQPPLLPHTIDNSTIPENIDKPGNLHFTPEELIVVDEQRSAATGSAQELPPLVSETPTENIKPKTEIETLQSEDSEEVAPDPFHPEQEEILEEIEQEKIDKEVEEQASTITEGEDHAITLPVHDEDNQIIDEFVESQHHQTSENTSTTATNVVTTGNTKQEEPLIPIEPYYTIDYFASQGIKFTPEKDPQDRLGKQLKSFTQWLKHMKKIGPEDAIKPIEDSPEDSKIKGIADNSNTTGDILTEAMAEVLEKQGKTEQAIEVYNKLSFLNQDKSAYFADKIQKLKGI